MSGRTRVVRLASALILSLAASAPSPARAAFGAVGDLFVTGDVSNTVRSYGGTTGSFIGLFGNPNNSPLGIHFGALNGRVLVGGFGGGILEFDAGTGAYIKTYGPPLWAWSAVYAPNGNVLVASSATDQILEYDSVTGAFIQLFAPLPGSPADMRYGPNGNLYVCSFYNSMVWELDPVTGNPVSVWSTPQFSQPNDVAFLNGEILVTSMATNVVYRYDSTPVHNLLGSFTGTGWGNPHGIVISPHDGHIYVADGVTSQVHRFDPTTFIETHASWLSPPPGDKIVDLDFRVDNRPTPSVPTTWGRLKTLYR